MKYNLTLATLILAAGVVLPASAQPMREFSVQATSPQDLAATGEWTKVSKKVWQRNLEGVKAEMAFGEAALEISLDHIEAEINRLGTPKTRQQEIDLLELELRRDELLAAARRLLTPTKTTSQQTICGGGTATFTHWYGQTWFFTYTVRSKSSYGEPGPVSPYTKTAYARAKACTTTSPYYCDEPPPATASTASYAVTSEVEASRYPASGAAREAFGYVLVVSNSNGGCTDIKSFSTSVPN